MYKWKRKLCQKYFHAKISPNMLMVVKSLQTSGIHIKEVITKVSRQNTTLHAVITKAQCSCIEYQSKPEKELIIADTLRGNHNYKSIKTQNLRQRLTCKFMQ
ncbi:hypothetical protein PoB_001558000 [Plakobranchus ocellatus]|uniref:Uncharacterized protein n=1 Tax=Plakobranchus ocellatus TaxID=259542 RepID=A0AAV3Z110_9GAST|nr:hypothetical protein PoB_001558000 [Plakobranchus ocellatus]